jgi:hypothetical protein
LTLNGRHLIAAAHGCPHGFAPPLVSFVAVPSMESKSKPKERNPMKRKNGSIKTYPNKKREEKDEAFEASLKHGHF